MITVLLLSQIKKMLDDCRALIIPSGKLADEQYRRVKEKNPRKKNINYTQPAFNNTPWVEERIAYKGAYKGWYGSSFTPTVQCYGVVNGTTLYTNIDGIINVVYAPAGCHWSRINDDAVLMHTKTGVESHLDSDQVMRSRRELKTTMSQLVAIRTGIMREQKQKQKSRQQKYKAFAAANITLTRESSRSAGNCSAGTESFLRELKLHKLESVTSAKLIKLINRNIEKISPFHLDRLDWVIENELKKLQTAN